MDNGGQTADQVVRMTLQGIEVAAKVSMKVGEETSKTLAATLYAILTDKKKVKGKTRLNSLLRSGKELKVYALRNEDLKTFCKEAKRYGVLYCVLKEKGSSDGICDIMVRAEDASKISRIVDKFELATVDSKQIQDSLNVDEPIMTMKEHDDLVKSLMDSTSNPSLARMEKKEDLFEPSCEKTSIKKKIEKMKEKVSKTKKIQKEIKR